MKDFYRTTLRLDSTSQLKALAEMFNAVGIFGGRAPGQSVSAGLRALAQACLSWTPQQVEAFKSLLTPPDPPPSAS